MTYEEIRHAWNAQAEDFNQWAELGLIEKVEYAARLGAAKARGPAPIFHQKAQKNLEHLQRKGFNVVGYALEQHNSWTDNRRCTVDSKGLVRWIPSTSQEVAAERAARKKAQKEVVALKERIAGALHEALHQEREACAKVCEGLVSADACARQIRARNWGPGSLWGNIRNEMSAAIRARQ